MSIFFDSLIGDEFAIDGQVLFDRNWIGDRLIKAICYLARKKSNPPPIIKLNNKHKTELENQFGSKMPKQIYGPYGAVHLFY